jgi:hypothetical protein
MITTTTTTSPHRERVLTVRVTFDHIDELKREARQRKVTVSQLIREHLSGKK